MHLRLTSLSTVPWLPLLECSPTPDRRCWRRRQAGRICYGWPGTFPWCRTPAADHSVQETPHPTLQTSSLPPPMPKRKSNVKLGYVIVHSNVQRWLGSVTVRTLDLRSRGRGFDSRLGCYQVVSTWMGDCVRKGKPSRYITNTMVNSAFHPFGVGKSSTGLHGRG